jgi:hypothetical protein
VKLLFDECIGYGIYEALWQDLVVDGKSITHSHMLDFTGRQGVADDIWVPRAANEHWMVITGDSGRSGLGAPLHILMPAHGVTGIYLSGKLQTRPARVKIEAIRAVLKELPGAYAGPRGLRYRLRMDGESFSLRQWPVVGR